MNNKLKFSHLALSLLIALSACGGGSGGGGSNNNPNPPDPDAILAPLTMRIEQSTSDQGLVNWVDLRKVAGHTTFKLIVTNTNKVNIKFNGIAFVNRITQDFKYNGPLIANTISFIKNSNPDNCLNQASLAPNASCTYYAYGIWTPNYEFSNQSIFNGEVQYSITDSNNQRRTCYGDWRNGWGICHDLVGNGIPFQFKLTPLTQIQDERIKAMANSIQTWISMDGKYGIARDGNGFSRYNITFANGQLSLSNPIHADNSEMVDYGFIVIDKTGANLVYKEGVLTMGRNHYVANTQTYTTPILNIPLGSTLSFDLVVGNNGSVWLSPREPSDIAAVFNGVDDIWNSTPLDHTNTSIILGIDSTGVIIARDQQGNFKCIHTDYSRQDLQGYDMTFANNPYNKIGQGRYHNSATQDEAGLISYRGVFVPMYVNQNNFYNADGTHSNPWVAYFKVNTDNGNCQIDTNDYYVMNHTFMAITPNFIMMEVIKDGSEGQLVTSTNNL